MSKSEHTEGSAGLGSSHQDRQHPGKINSQPEKKAAALRPARHRHGAPTSSSHSRHSGAVVSATRTTSTPRSAHDRAIWPALAAFAIRSAALRNDPCSGGRVGTWPDRLQFIFHLFIDTAPFLCLGTFLPRIGFDLFDVSLPGFPLLFRIRHGFILLSTVVFRGDRSPLRRAPCLTTPQGSVGSARMDCIASGGRRGWINLIDLQSRSTNTVPRPVKPGSPPAVEG
jgi:hypothetical protein